MAKIKFQKKEIENHFPLTDKILERINLMGTTVESLTKEELELEIPANRPDLLSLQGFVRNFLAFESKSVGLKEYKMQKKTSYQVKIEKSVKSVRPYTVCAVIKDLKLDEDKLKELIALQEKLHLTIGRKRKKAAIGIYPLEKIAFPIKFTAAKPDEIKFIPLGQNVEMNAHQILLKHPAGKEYADLLKNLTHYPIFIDSNKKILSMPPIINSQETGQVTTKTKELFVECSGFDKPTLNRILAVIVTSLADMGGTIHAVKIQDTQDELTPNLEPEKHKISKEYAEKILGFELTEKDISNYLARMGHKYERGTVHVGAWRADVIHEVDLVEDIAIAYGYDKIRPHLPELATIGQESRNSTMKNKILESLTGLGLLEISSLHFITQEEHEKSEIKKKIEVENSRTEYTILRPSLLLPMLRTLGQNTDSEYPQNICEIGKVFNDDPQTETGVNESEHLCIGLAPGNFTQIKQHLDYVFKMLGLKYELKEKSHHLLIEGRTGSITLNGIEIGYLGEVHPSTLQNWKIKMPISVLEINLEEIYKLFEY